MKLHGKIESRESHRNRFLETPTELISKGKAHEQTEIVSPHFREIRGQVKNN